MAEMPSGNYAEASSCIVAWYQLLLSTGKFYKYKKNSLMLFITIQLMKAKRYKSLVGYQRRRCGRREKGARNRAKRADAGGGDMQHAKRMLLGACNAHLVGGLCPDPLPTG